MRVSHHLMIGGTGRAGTTLMVKYLTELGLDTILSRNPSMGLHSDAEAGLESVLLQGDPASHPYVVKDPWLYQYAEELLADPRIRIDGLILPIRDLREAASSRIILERLSMHQTTPWLKDLKESWNSWGTTPGGLVYSLNPVDEERILAVGFYDVIEKFTRANIPVALVHFDRLFEDPNYLFDKLEPVFQSSITREQAISAHAAVVDLTKARVGAEMKSESSTTLDRIALGREVSRLGRELAAAKARKKSFWKTILKKKVRS